MSSPTYTSNKQSKQNDSISPSVPVRPLIISPAPSTRSNGILNSSSPNNTSISPKVNNRSRGSFFSYENIFIQPQHPPPPVPAKPKFRTSNTSFVPINGDDQSSPPRIQPQNGFEIDEVIEIILSIKIYLFFFLI